MVDTRLFRVVCLTSMLMLVWAVPADAAATPGQLAHKLAALERGAGGRLGVAYVEHGGRKVEYRGDERFAMCSTFKALLAAAILKEAEADATYLEKVIPYGQGDLVSWSPVTEKHVRTGMTVSALCAAAVQHSDNTAANLLLAELGGPPGLTAFVRSLGDSVFRLDRWETELNSAIPDDERDTTSPAAMAETMRQLALGDALSPQGRAQFVEWLKGNTTGNECIRAGLPAGLIVGDKTGAGDYGTTNDVAVVWPPSGKPFVLAVYFTHNRRDAPARRDVLARATALVVEALGHRR